jgi:hypothetical protein
MKSAGTVSGSSFSPNGNRPVDGDFTETQATRYLSAAAYLRRAMLPDEITELGMRLPRAPYPVGRPYAIRVLFGSGGVLPMPSVQVDRVRKHCWASLRQTLIRDVATIAVLVCAWFIDPWGTVIIFGVIVLAVATLGRVRLSSPIVLAAALGVGLGLFVDGSRESASFAVPLIFLFCCFLIYMADILWSVRRVRRLWKSPSAALPVSVTTARPTGQAGSYHADAGDHDDEHEEMPADPARQVYYDKDGIVGAGTPFTLLPLTVPLDKPREPENDVLTFTAAQLLEYIGDHLFTQGPGDGQQHGYARSPLTAHGDQPGGQQGVHFTYGLPYLDVGPVVAVPVPSSKKIPLLPLKTTPLHHPELPPARDVAEVAGRSPSEHPERNYVRATSSSWDGQLVASAYVSSALQGHYLRVVIRPYVLGPIVADLKAADELRERHLLVQVGVAAGLALRQFVSAGKKLRGPAHKPDRPLRAKPVKRGLLSIRELYAQPVTDNVHQAEDADRILRVIELKVIRVTMDYLRACNVDVGEFETQITAYVQTNTIVGAGQIITGGTITNSSVSATNNQGNRNPGGEKPGQ